MLNKLFGSCEVQVKADNSREFTAYGNTKDYKDKVGDNALDGCYKIIKMPKLLWSHDRYQLPLGPIKHAEEDSKGLLFSGKLSNTAMANDVYELAKDNALDEFSIGYVTLKEKWNNNTKTNDLHEILVKEISFVNFACNDQSVLQSIKQHIDEGDLPTKRELQNFLREKGLSKKQAELISNQYNPAIEKKLEVMDVIRKSSLFQ